ncbi:MAG: B12-binding domain-containing radical SAM protein, partial [Planctomycetes bacterium]|nr:B12-binding domain-containing radical SAM protein [Planctomycetota bacterium]
EALQFQPCPVVYEPTDMDADFRARLESFQPQLVGFSVVEPTFYVLRRLLAASRDLLSRGSIRVAVGGVHAIYWPESVAALPEVDFICVGEGEETFVELCARLESGADCRSQPGFWVRDGQGWARNPAPRLVDLDSLPPLDISDWGERYLSKPMMGKVHRTVSIELTRGCPYQCTYCGNAFLNETFAGLGKWYRLKSIDKIGAEYASLIARYQPAFIYKMSESFLAVPRPRLEAYAAMYREHRVPFWIETRPETVTEWNVRMLKDLGCARVSVGLESGNEEYRRRHLRRSYSNQQVLEAARLFHDLGVSFSFNLIIGMPYETREMVFDGIEILRDAKPDGFSVFLFTPYKGCVMRRLCEEKEMISPDFIGEDYFLMKYALRHNTFGPEVVGLWRTVPLYARLPKSRYPRIAEAERFDEKGDRAFAELRREYYDLMGWTPAPVA